jgi:acetolactate synthase-1/2/3 large subunit
MLKEAKKPLLLLGGGTWTDEACADVARFAEANGLPVACAFRFQDLLDNDHPHYAGDVGIGINPKLAARVKEADVLIAFGPRLGEMTTSGYSLLASPVPQQRLVHIHPDPQELGSVYQAELMIAGGAPETAKMLAAMEPVDASAWRHTVEEARAELRAWQEQPPIFKDGSAPLDLWQLVQDMQAALPHDTIITNGAGNYATWAHRYWRYGAMRTQLAPTSGAMGYGVPAGVAAKIVHPERTVVTFAGDGEFMMTGQELATAVQYRAGLVLIVFNNNMFGTIRMHQEREYPGRVSGTELHNPDFAALARAYGGQGEVVEKTADFAPALARAMAFTNEQKLPAVIELRYDGNLITPGATLETIRKNAAAAKKSKSFAEAGIQVSRSVPREGGNDGTYARERRYAETAISPDYPAPTPPATAPAPRAARFRRMGQESRHQGDKYPDDRIAQRGRVAAHDVVAGNEPLEVLGQNLHDDL